MNYEQKARMGREVFLPSHLAMLTAIWADLMEDRNDDFVDCPHGFLIEDYIPGPDISKYISFRKQLESMNVQHHVAPRVVRMKAMFNQERANKIIAVFFAFPASSETVALSLNRALINIQNRIEKLSHPDSATTAYIQRLTEEGRKAALQTNLEDIVATSISGVLTTLQAASFSAYGIHPGTNNEFEYREDLQNSLKTNLASQLTSFIEFGVIAGFTQTGIMPSDPIVINGRYTENSKNFISGANSVFALTQPVEGRCPFLNVHTNSTYNQMKRYYTDVDIQAYRESLLTNRNAIDITSQILSKII